MSYPPYPTNQQRPQQETIQVEIVDVDEENSNIVVMNGNDQEEYNVIFPANIRFAKKGLAQIKVTPSGQANFVKMVNNEKPAYKKPYNPYQKPAYKSGYQNNSFKPSNQYKPKEEIHYVSETKTLNQVTIEEFSKVYNDMSANGIWIVASNVFPTNMTTTVKVGDKEETRLLYDCIFFTKSKKANLDEGEDLI